MKIKKLILLFFLYLNVLFADTITLKNGKFIEGKIINQTRTKVQIQTEDGKTIILDKSEIRKIQFGPTRKELERKRQEELRRKQEEERRRQEELRRKQEEERKRQEELRRKKELERRRQEELRRKQEEERKRQEELRRKQQKPSFILKRNNLSIGYGIGNATIYPSYIKQINSFNFAKNIGSKLLNSDPTGDYSIANYKNQVGSNSLFIKYDLDKWTIGFNVSGFDVKDGISMNTIRNDNNIWYPGISQNNYKKSDYTQTHLWFSYIFYKINILSYESYLSLIGGIYSVNTEIEFDENLLVNNTYNINNYKITSDKNGFLSIGPSLKILFSKNHIFNVNLILLIGNFKWSLIINENKSFSLNNQDKGFSKIEVNTTGSSNGFLLEGEYNYIFYKNWYLFIKYQWNENRYKMKSSGKLIESKRSEGSPPPVLSSGLMNLLTFREKKIAIEKIQVIYFGVGYNFNFL